MDIIDIESRNYSKFLAEIRSLLSPGSPEKIIENFISSIGVIRETEHYTACAFMRSKPSETERKSKPWQEELQEFILSARHFLSKNKQRISDSEKLLEKLNAVATYLSENHS